jgi:hypothetical protein
MPNPIFKQQDMKLNGVFTANKAKLMFSTGSGCDEVTGVLVQAVNFTFVQNVTRLYEIGTDDSSGGGSSSSKANVYYVVGRCQGQAQLNRVVGPKATIGAMYSCYGDVCKACDNDMTLQLDETDCCTGEGASLTYTLKFVAMTQVGISLQAQDMIINETCQLMFSGLEFSDNMAG